jgi:probable rRNA maturation factor
MDDNEDRRTSRVTTTAAAALFVDVVEIEGDWARIGAVDGLIEAVAIAVAARCKLPQGPVVATVALSVDTDVRRLNREFRGLDKPTNVLSFPAPEVAPGTSDHEPRPLGDVIIALETLEREAAAEGKAPADHLRHLTIHGLLHLLGYDHETVADAEVMEALEIAILDDLGVANPYADSEPIDDPASPRGSKQVNG